MVVVLLQPAPLRETVQQQRTGSAWHLVFYQQESRLVQHGCELPGIIFFSNKKLFYGTCIPSYHPVAVYWYTLVHTGTLRILAINWCYFALCVTLVGSSALLVAYGYYAAADILGTRYTLTIYPSCVHRTKIRTGYIFSLV